MPIDIYNLQCSCTISNLHNCLYSITQTYNMQALYVQAISLFYLVISEQY